MSADDMKGEKSVQDGIFVGPKVDCRIQRADNGIKRWERRTLHIDQQEVRTLRGKGIPDHVEIRRDPVSSMKNNERIRFLRWRPWWKTRKDWRQDASKDASPTGSLNIGQQDSCHQSRHQRWTDIQDKVS